MPRHSGTNRGEKVPSAKVLTAGQITPSFININVEASVEEAAKVTAKKELRLCP